jgi:UDP-N-acetylglucosamine 4,6-dehydratase
MRNIFKRKNILISGGSGSLGHALIEKLLPLNPGKIIIYSTDDMKHALTESKFNDNRLRFVVGDIRDYDRLSIACRDVDIIIHTASLKNVDRGEYNALEYKSVIVDGAETIIKVCMNNPKITNVVALSTDKASGAGTNLYGCAKALSDKLFVSANNMCSTKFSVIRYGNVINSNGSIVKRVETNKEENTPINLTDERMTRFWITLDYASSLVLFLCNNMEGGEIFIPKLPSMNVKDFLSQRFPGREFKIIGIRPGEKLHESMFLKCDCIYILEYKYFFIIYPQIIKTHKMFGDLIGNIIETEFEYNSLENERFLDKDKDISSELSDIGGWLVSN